jgi:hypothetical protein
MTAEDLDDEQLPQHMLDAIAKQPALIDRRAGAALVTTLVFPTSPLSVKSWSLPWAHPNGRALAPPVAYVKYAVRKARLAHATTPRWAHLNRNAA